MKAVVFLQNAWSPLYAGREWPRPSWLRALARCRSGKRLAYLIDDLSICENTTPIVGDAPDSIVKPDNGHILSVLAEREPDIVITCGKQAEKALEWIWSGPMLAVPHPAAHGVSNALFAEFKKLLVPGYQDRKTVLWRPKENIRYAVVNL